MAGRGNIRKLIKKAEAGKKLSPGEKRWLSAQVKSLESKPEKQGLLNRAQKALAGLWES